MSASPQQPSQAPPQGPPQGPPLDLVTSLQEQLGRVNALLFNYVGALQRDAPPAAVKDEPLVAAPKAYDVQARCVLGLLCACCGRCVARGHEPRQQLVCSQAVPCIMVATLPSCLDPMHVRVCRRRRS